MPSASTSARMSSGSPPMRSSLRRNTAMARHHNGGGTASGVIPHRSWLFSSALLASATYLLLWIGYVLQWNWLATVDRSALDPFFRHGVAHPGWVTGWDVFCTVLGPTAFRLVTLVVIVVAFVRRNLRVAMFLLISVELSGLITEAGQNMRQIAHALPPRWSPHRRPHFRPVMPSA